MATVTNTIKLPDGTAPTYAAVTIELVASTSGHAAGWVNATDVTVLASANPTVTAGAWTASLTPNADIDPAGTVYRITEHAGRYRYVHYISVGSGGGTVHDLLVDAPTSLPTAPLTAHLADTADAHDASAVSVLDTAANFAGSDVEAVLAEIAASHTAVATSARVAPGPRWVYFGDSIVQGTGSTNVIFAFPWLSIQFVGALVARTDSHEAGTAGETAANFVTRLATVLAYEGVEAMVLEVGTNDAGAGRTLAQFSADMTTIMDATKAAGIPLVVCTVLPRAAAASAAIQRLVVAYNQWIKFHASHWGAEVADIYTAVADPADGFLDATLDSGDGIHPNNLGHTRIASTVGAAMKRLFNRTGAYGLITANHIGVTTPDPLVATGTTLSDDWFEQPGGTGTAATYSIVEDVSGVLPAGRWQQIDIDAAANTVRTLSLYADNTTYSVGDVLVINAFVQIDDESSDWEANVVAGTAEIDVRLVDGDTGSVKRVSFDHSAGIGTVGGTYNLGPVAIPHLTVADYSASLWVRMRAPSGSHYTFRVGCVGLVNATELGIEDEYESGLSGLIFH